MFEPKLRGRKAGWVFPVLAGIAAAGVLAGALAIDFAALTIRATGRQMLDLVTGVTTLIDGGTVVDRTRNLRLEAAWLEYRENLFIRARNAVLINDQGRLVAPELRIDTRAETVVVVGGAEFTSATVGLAAEYLHLNLSNNFVTAQGNVRTQGPAGRADTLIIDTDRRRVLMIGHVQVADPGRFRFTVNSPDGAVLLVYPVGSGRANATTVVTRAEREAMLAQATLR